MERVVTKEVEVEVVRFVEKEPERSDKTERNVNSVKGHLEEEREDENASGIEPRTEKRLDLLGVSGVERDEIEESSETVNRGKESRRYDSKEVEGDSYAQEKFEETTENAKRSDPEEGPYAEEDVKESPREQERHEEPQ